MADVDPERIWEPGWEGHERAQQRRLARLPLIEKIRWLEEMQAMLLHLRRPTASNAIDEPPR